MVQGCPTVRRCGIVERLLEVGQIANHFMLLHVRADAAQERDAVLWAQLLKMLEEASASRTISRQQLNLPGGRQNAS